MEANNQTEKPVETRSIKGLINAFFPELPYSPVEEELWNWFMFAISGKGNSIKDLQAKEFAQFSDQLIKLIGAVYQFTNLQQAAANQQGARYHG
jgi:hypothetical protein